MSKEKPAVEQAAAESKSAKWWCNFCDFKSDDQREYLSHSCTEFLKQQGKSTEPTGQNSCG